MSADEWSIFVWDNRTTLIEQIKSHLPEVDFTDIKEGFAPSFVHLQRRGSEMDLTIETVVLGLDEEHRIRRVEVVDLL